MRDLVRGATRRASSPYAPPLRPARLRRRAAIAALLSLLLAAPTPAQETPAPATPAPSVNTGVVAGVVVDDGGLPIPNVHVTIASEALIGGPQQALTTAEGRFDFDALPPGVYELLAERAPFETVHRTGLQVLTGRRLLLTVEMPLQGSGEELVIEDVRRPSIQLEAAQQSVVLTKEFLSRIPTGRDYHTAYRAPAGVIGGSDDGAAGLRPAPALDAGAHRIGGERWIAPADTEGYADYGVNGMTLTAEDGFSTFSIDVDTASYTIARRKLKEGALPPEAAVRVEEFVNFFRYDYPQPEGDAPFAVHMEGAPHPSRPDRHVLRFGVQGQEIPAAQRRPMRLTFLVDVSGSMGSPDKIGLVKRSLRHLVEQLGPADSVAMATYAGAVRAVLEPTRASEQRAIFDAIDDLQASGSTAMSSGIELAYRMASDGYVRGAENRVIVLSDGDANVGRTSHEEILETVRRYAGEGITLSTIGFGMGNYKDTMMEQLADQGDGNYYYVDSFAEARRIFGERLGGTLQTIARDVKIQVEFNPAAVHAYRLLGYENRDIADPDFRNDQVDAGEIGEGHQVTALYEVALRDGWRAHEIAAIRLRSKPPGPDAPADEWVTVMRPGRIEGSFEGSSDGLRLAWSAATFAELLRGSPYVAEVSWASLEAIADDARRAGWAADRELVGLIRRAAELSPSTVGAASGP